MGAIEFIRKAVAAGVVIALGHTAADGPTLARGCRGRGQRSAPISATGLPRRWPGIRTRSGNRRRLDALDASLIADGHHLDSATLRVLVRAKSPAAVILVSDASPLAALPPGRYGEWAVDPSGKIVVAGTPYLAGSNQGIEVGLNLLDGGGRTLTG